MVVKDVSTDWALENRKKRIQMDIKVRVRWEKETECPQVVRYEKINIIA